MSNNRGARTALRIAEFIKPDEHANLTEGKAAEVSELLLQMSLEASQWPDYVPSHIYLGMSSPVAQRLAKGNVSQATTAATYSRDPALLDSMARRDRRRQVRAALACNPALTIEAAENLWKREAEDAPKTGADPYVLARLIQRMSPQRAIEAYLDACTMYWNTTHGARRELAVAVAEVIVREGSTDEAISFVVESVAKFPEEQRGYSHGAWYEPNPGEYAVYVLTQHVLHGNLAISLTDWIELVTLAGPNCVDIAGQAAWVAAEELPQRTRDPLWGKLAAQAFSHRYSAGYSFGTLSDRSANGLRSVLQDLDASVAADVTRQSHSSLVLQIVRALGADLPLLVTRAMLVTESAAPVIQEYSRMFTELVQSEDDVAALLAILGPASVEKDGYNWGQTLHRVPMKVELQRRLLSHSALAGWITGVNTPTDTSLYDECIAALFGEDTERAAKAVALAFRQDLAPTAIMDHAWRTTPGLPALFIANHSQGLEAFSSRMLVAELGGDPSAWDTVLRLLPDWGGSFGDLLNVAAAL